MFKFDYVWSYSDRGLMFQRPSPKVPDKYIPKWSRSVLREGFVPFPRRLMRCASDIFRDKDAVRELQVILAIADAKREEPYRSPTLGFLAYNAGMSEADFEECVNELVEKELVEVEDDDDRHFEVDLGPLLKEIRRLTPAGS